jgi:hypothetical protein
MFFLWYKFLDIDFLDGTVRKVITFVSSAILEVTPIFNAFLFWTFGTVVMIAIVRFEDKLHNKRVLEERREAEREMQKRVAKIIGFAPSQGERELLQELAEEQYYNKQLV